MFLFRRVCRISFSREKQFFPSGKQNLLLAAIPAGERQGGVVDTDLILLIGAGCLAAIIIALSARLSGRRKAAKAGPARQGAVRRDEESLFEQFKRLAAEQPTNPELWLKWGRELVAAGDAARHPNMRLHRYNEACSCFQSATDLDPLNAAVWRNWGQTLYALYRLQGCEDRLLLDNAHTRFQTAARLTPADAALWQHWGDELYTAASQCPRAEQRHELQDLADAKFAKAVELNPELILEWKKWRGSGLQRLETRTAPEPETAGTAAPEPSGQSLSEAALDEGGPPAPSLPWAHGAARPVEASAWLNRPGPANASGQTPSILLPGGKP